MFVWRPEKQGFEFCGSDNPRYYCKKCKHIHYFNSKKGKEHIEFGKYPNFPFLPGNIIINLKGVKLTPIKEE